MLKNPSQDSWSAVAKVGKIHVWNLLSRLETGVASDGAFGVCFSVLSQDSGRPEFSILLFWEHVQGVLCSRCYSMLEWGMWEKPLDGHSARSWIWGSSFLSFLGVGNYLKLNKFLGSGPSIPSHIPSLEEFLTPVRKEQDIFGM